MPPCFADPTDNSIPLFVVSVEDLEEWKSSQDEKTQNWVAASGFRSAIGQAITIPNEDGTVKSVVVGYGTEKTRARSRFNLAAAVPKIGDGTYALSGDLSDVAIEEEALGWLLASYRYDRYKSKTPQKAHLICPSGLDRKRIEAIATGEYLTRDLINTPSSDMGPQELEDAFEGLADRFDATTKVISGDMLLEQNFPMIHTVGRASSRLPRLLDMRWGTKGPKLTLVGKGVCFDTGGLNIKPGGSMGLMKKDMGGSAAVMGLAHMIMAMELPLQLRVLVPAVENSISGSAFRPQDVLTSRKGLTVEINNTDAEGRLVLADALALADEENPDCIISMATLTGAARVAVGPDLAPYYSDDLVLVRAIEEAAQSCQDPVWRMPFHAPYEKMIEPMIADLDNAPAGGFAGSITAALFLKRFVENAPYIHFDIYGWQPTAAPARQKGGVGQGTRALFEALPEILGF